MSEQLFLFDDDDPARRLARRDGPETSHEAAAAIVTRLADIQRWVLGLVRQTPGLTAQELGQAHGVGDIRKMNRRLPELEQLGLLRRGKPRKCRVTGKSAHTWDVA